MRSSKYLSEDPTSSPTPPQAQSASFLSSTLNSFQRLLKVSSTCFSPYRVRWQVSVCLMALIALSSPQDRVQTPWSNNQSPAFWSLPLFSSLITERQADRSTHCSNTPNTIPLQYLCLECVLPPIPPAWILPFFQAWFSTLSFHRNLPWPCPEKLEHLFSGHLVQAALVYVFSFCENLIPKIDF